MEKIFQVNEFIEIANIMLAPIGKVIVEGELTELKVSQNKWVFGILKDPVTGDVVNVFSIVFKLQNLDSLVEGMQVQILGTATISGKNSRFSISADTITPAGEGAYKIALQKLTAQLEKEGLFNSSRKRPLPDYPEHVGLIAAKQSEAYNDFIRIARNRYNYGRIDFLPASVQGQKAINEIINALTHFNSLPKIMRPEVIVLIRGGGSLEDLAAFNDEQIARAIYRSQIPIVVGVGHEGDTTLSDLVADRRASTPSNAAEICYPTRTMVLENIINLGVFGYQTLQLHRHRLTQNLDYKTLSLNTFFNTLQERYLKSIGNLSSEIYQLLTHCEHIKNNLLVDGRIFTQGLSNRLLNLRQVVEHRMRSLKDLDYSQLLKRGFSITMQDNKIINRLDQLSPDQPITNIISDGLIISNYQSKEYDEK